MAVGAYAKLLGDTVLQQNIDKEISDRTSADTLLDNKFTGLINTESTARCV